MTKLRELTSLALLAPRIARSATLAMACARIVDDLARTMKLQCAIVEISGQSRAVVCSSPHELRVPEDPAAATQIPLGGAGGTIGGQVMGPERLRTMDGYGMDMQALSINPFWYTADRTLSSKLIELQNDKLAEICAAQPDRFVPLAAVALQHPDLAALQLEDARKKHNMRGAAIGCSVEGAELSDSKFDPFWAKAQELEMLLFMHPQASDRATGITKRVAGQGVLGNVIGNPLETTIALSHLIFEGTLDKFPNLRLCAAHGGGYLPSYADRSDHGCLVFPEQCKGLALKKHPTEYLRQIYVDSLVFTPEALRHLIAVVGVDHIMLGTDYPFPWVDAPVDHVLKTPGLSDANRIAIAGGTAAKLLGITHS